MNLSTEEDKVQRPHFARRFRRMAGRAAPAAAKRHVWRIGWMRQLLRTPRIARLFFHCNVCGRRSACSRLQLGRETASCGWCGSTIRLRALVHALSNAVFDGQFDAPIFPTRKELSGIGFSDHDLYASHLTRATDYENSWFHRAPVKDLMTPESFGAETYDFVVCSEVLEHVDRPVETAYQTLFGLLKPGGVLVMSTPMTEGESVEHFPVMVHYGLTCEGDTWRLDGETVDGTTLVAGDLIFHGGPGSTLEMRLAGRDSVKRTLEEAGFVDIEERISDLPAVGVWWSEVGESMQTAGGVVRGLRAGIWLARRP